VRFYTNIQVLGNDVLVRGYENGQKVMFREEFYPTLFVKSKAQTKYKTLEGEHVEPIQPGNIRDCREFFRKYEDVEGFKIYGNERFIYQYISEKYPEDEIKFDIQKIGLVTMDIEVKSEQGFPDPEHCNEEMLTISIQDYATKKITTWGRYPYTPKQDNVTYHYHPEEADMLNAFLFWWSNNYPEVVTGWNTRLYDIPYICGRIDRVLGPKKVRMLSPWGRVTHSELAISGRKYNVFEIAGITGLDYLELYKKFTYTNRESYRLDYIADVELGQKKLDHSEFDTFKDFYTNDWTKFVDYNIVDVELVDRMEDKLRLIELVITMAYDAKVNFVDPMFQVRLWDTIIYNYLKKKNIVVPPKERSGDKDEKFAGAYVKEPKPGVYDWVVSFDLNSLYPHLMMQYNISPETLVDDRHPSVTVDKILNEELTFEMYSDYAVCANGAMFRKDVKGFMPELMEKMYAERKAFKKEMLKCKQKLVDIEAKIKTNKDPVLVKQREQTVKDIAKFHNFQMVRKICLNSCYGAIGNAYFRYFKLANAEAITLSGQTSIRWIEGKMNKFLNNILKTENIDYVIASDTDSIYINFGPVVDKFLAKFEGDKEQTVTKINQICEDQLEPYIDKCYNELASYVNAYDQKMQMKRENIADRGIWTAKKRYILNVWDSEGVRYEEPKLKIMGIEAVKSSTPAPCRTMIKDALKLMMSASEDDVIEYIEQARIKFKKMPAEEIAFPRSVSDVNKHKNNQTIYGKGCPMHVRGALLHNHYVRKAGLENKYSMINNGDKIKFIHLKKPNPMGENVISFQTDFPRELNLQQYIDYDVQFNKAFLEPVKVILDAINWNVEKTVNLESFFG
jgi:DNA polymerase elongation subunit (family B)